MVNLLVRAFQALLRAAVGSILTIQSYTLLSVRAVANLFSRPVYWREIVLQMDRVGVGSLTIVVLTGFFTGAVMAIQSEGALRRYG
ncbi:MAG: ABC transporter permease, partial [Acidobacteria bacterium]|nr:ABC transporter permease [Acidobacteriota bacterium]